MLVLLTLCYGRTDVGKERTYVCIQCGTETVGRNCRFMYCTLKCQQAAAYKERIERWKSGKEQGWTGKTAVLCKWVRRYLHESRGTACELCGWDERHPVDGAVLTEVDHVDGNAHNCGEDNLKILCPNCHAKTPTHRARNKTSVRTR